MDTPSDGNTPESDNEHVARIMEWARETGKIASDLMTANPTLNYATAQIMAGDILSAREATDKVIGGEDATTAIRWVGSYARWDWVVTMVRTGRITGEWFAENIADLWVSADPDDTNPDNLAIWRKAYNDHGGLIRDGRPLPKPGGDRMLKVFRGGSPFTVKAGISWTLDPKIAGKFAATLGGRVKVHGGVVVTGLVRPADVLAYLTDRGESEVIIDPRLVRDIHPTGEGS